MINSAERFDRLVTTVDDPHGMVTAIDHARDDA